MDIYNFSYKILLTPEDRKTLINKLTPHWCESPEICYIQPSWNTLFAKHEFSHNSLFSDNIWVPFEYLGLNGNKGSRALTLTSAEQCLLFGVPNIPAQDVSGICLESRQKRSCLAWIPNHSEQQHEAAKDNSLELLRRAEMYLLKLYL